MHYGCRTVVLAAVPSKPLSNVSLTRLSRLASSMSAFEIRMMFFKFSRRNSTASDGDKLMGPKSKGLLSFVVERTSKKRDAWRHGLPLTTSVRSIFCVEASTSDDAR